MAGAVVGGHARDDLGLSWLALELVVLLGNLPGGFNCLATTGGEEDAV